MNSKTKNQTVELPSVAEMYRALCDRNSQYEGVFFVGVRTTGVFCRPTCPARKPKLKNVDFYSNANDAVAAGFRPCKKCRPLEVFGAAPVWLNPLLKQVEHDPSRRWTDSDLRKMDLEPTRVRRWFQQNHGMTFHSYLRSRRLSTALGQIRVGEKTTGAAFENGYDSLSGFRDAFKKWFGDTPSNSRGHGGPISVNRILTPLGPMVAAAGDDGLYLLEFADRRLLETQLKRVKRAYQRAFVPASNAVIEQAEKQLAEYFDGNRREFSIPIELIGTKFQEAVWKQLLKIPYGQTVSYDSLAREIGHEGAQRAVGRANGDNRFAIVIPCHRVIRSDGSLSGYGGGLWRKRWLLDHEQKRLF